jgi:hypothetical protein
MLTLIELIQVKKNRENLMFAYEGDTLPAIVVWFHHYLAGFSSAFNNFCFFDYCHYPYCDSPYTLLETD